MTLRWRTMGAVAALLATTGCQSIFGFESSTDLVTCVKDDDCNTGEVCSAHACIASACLEGGCSAKDGSTVLTDLGIQDPSTQPDASEDQSVDSAEDEDGASWDEDSELGDGGSPSDGSVDGQAPPTCDAGTGSCPSIAPAELPTPCAHNPYAADFTVVGGREPYTWKALSLPQGLVFNVQTRSISGTVEAAGDLTLQIIDSEGKQAEQTYSLVPRDQCWLAYLSTDTESSHLNLFDPVLGSRRTFPATSSSPGVSDFQFSPDGNLLAYRLTAASGMMSLRVIQISTWSDQPLDLPGSAIQYAWSNKSLALAVAYQLGTATYLGAFQFSGAISASTDAGADAMTPGTDGGSQGVERLVPAGPTDVPILSRLTWLGDRYIAYAAAASGTLQEPYYAEMTGNAISQPEAPGISEYAPPLSLLAGQGGFFAIGSDGAMDFYGVRSTDQTTFDMYNTAVADPAGRYVARVQSSQLQIYPTGVDQVSPSPWPPSAGTPACPVLLAWARDVERLACVANLADAGAGDVPSSLGKVWRFDADPTAQKLSAEDIRGQYTYTEGAAFERRRAFSPSGRWLAFTTKSTLYLASLLEDSPNLWGTYPAVTDTDTDSTNELSFSPDERLLLWHRGTHVSVISLDNAGHWFPEFANSTPLPIPSPCSEVFLKGPADWCGNVQNPGPLSWSSDSRLAAAWTAAGILKVWDFQKFRTPNDTTLNIIDACTQGCANQFAFQP